MNDNRVEEFKEGELRYLGIRFVEVVCIAVFVFGFLWNSSEVLKLTASQFMMLYGGVGALVSEGLARIFKKKSK